MSALFIYIILTFISSSCVIPAVESSSGAVEGESLASLLHSALTYRYGLPLNHSARHNAISPLPYLAILSQLTLVNTAAPPFKLAAAAAAAAAAASRSWPWPFSALAAPPAPSSSSSSSYFRRWSSSWSSSPSSSPLLSSAAFIPSRVNIGLSISFYQTAVNKYNSSTALTALAEIYMFGEGGTHINLNTAMEYINAAQSAGNSMAQHYLATLTYLTYISQRSTNLYSHHYQQDEDKTDMQETRQLTESRSNESADDYLPLNADALALTILNDYFSSLDHNVYALLTSGYRHSAGINVHTSCTTALRYYQAAAEQTIRLLDSFPIQPAIERRAISNDISDEEQYLSHGHVDETGRIFNSHEDDEDVVAYHMAAAHNGDLVAAVNIGHLYYYGARGFIQDATRAYEYYTLAASSSSITADRRVTSAFVQLAKMYLHGFGVDRSYERARQFAQDAVDAGQSSAHAILALLYLRGVGGLEQSFTMAYEHARLANSSDGYFIQGKIKLTGGHSIHTHNQDTEKTNKKEVDTTDKLFASVTATAVGDSENDDDDDDESEQEDKVQQSVGEALHYFTLASKRGHIRAMYQLALMHVNGIGTIKSCHIGIILMRVVAHRSLGSLRHNIAARLYDRGMYERALMIYLMMSVEGDELAQSNAAFMLRQSLGTDVIKRFQRKHISESAAPLHQLPSSSSSLLSSVLSSVPPIVIPSPVRYYLEYLSSTTDVTIQRLAHTLLVWSSDQNNNVSVRTLGDYAYFGWPPYNVTEPDYDEAFRLYEQAAYRGVTRAMYDVAYCYENGYGVKRNWAKALMWLDRCQRANNATAVIVYLSQWRVHLHRWLVEGSDEPFSLNSVWSAMVSWFTPATEQQWKFDEEDDDDNDAPRTASITPATSSSLSASKLSPSPSLSHVKPSKSPHQHSLLQRSTIWVLDDSIILLVCLVIAIIIYIRHRV